MILEAFLNGFVIKRAVSGEATFLKIGACGELKLSLFSYRFHRKAKASLMFLAELGPRGGPGKVYYCGGVSEASYCEERPR